MIFAVMCLRNEEYHLPTFFEHIRKYVDGFVALDDGSTDKTISILENEHKMLKVIKNPVTNKLDWDEAENRKTLLNETYKLSTDKDNTWVLCCDPDERFELRFLKKMKSLCKPEIKIAYGVHFREIHDNKKYYRCDGIWNDKQKFILFPLQKEMDYDSIYNHRHHINWYYKEISDKLELTEYNLYHLKMLKKSEREKRANLYNKLDPNLEIQPIGYDYLYDDTNMKLQKISFGKRYDYSKIPEDLRNYKIKE